MTLELVDPPVTASSQPSWDGLRDLVQTHREQAEDGHERLRRDYRALAERVERLEHDHGTTGRRIDRIEQTPPNIDKMAWSTKQLIVIVVAAFGLGGGMWQLHSDMAAQAKLQDERNAALEKQVSAALAESRLNGIKTDDLSKQLTQYLLQHAK